MCHTGTSNDATCVDEYDRARRARAFVWLWNGKEYQNVISDQFAAPPE